jgi:hypothetical protein
MSTHSTRSSFFFLALLSREIGQTASSSDDYFPLPFNLFDETNDHHPLLFPISRVKASPP